MSDSPRKLIRRAADALGQLEDVLRRHPAAEDELRSALGAELLAALRRAAAAAEQANEALRAGDTADRAREAGGA